ncbi:5-oxoprolinase subunit C family protein [Pseudomonas phoenicis]|uniref:5-oxoprolinase subunit C family protein n=1 Tax=unclassified Pseudomonas TaxID=196821 RepID=UPI00399F2B04
MTALIVEKAGPHATVQDSGRTGVRHLGLTQGGALDWLAQHWANWMLGNALDAAVVEVTLGGLHLECQGEGWLALAGADLGATLDDQPLQVWRPFKVAAGQKVRFASPRLGARAYLAFPGGVQAPLVAGSCATVQREGVGGLDGRGDALRAGDRLACNAEPTAVRAVPAARIPDLLGPARLELILGAQAGGFTGQSLFDAFNRAWTVDARSDRMGLRLTGEPLHYTGPGLISEGIPLGAVQVPPDGQPIILLNDRQTIGGYPRLGALSPLAVARLAQCLPGETVHLWPQVAYAAQARHRQVNVGSA